MLSVFNDYDQAQKFAYLYQLHVEPNDITLLNTIIHSEQPVAVKICILSRMQK